MHGAHSAAHMRSHGPDHDRPTPPVCCMPYTRSTRLLPCATCTMISSPPPSSLSSLEANTCSFSFSSIKTTLIQDTTPGYELKIQLKVGVTLGSVSNAWMWCFIFYSFIKFQLLSHMNGLYCEVLATDK